MPNNKPYRQFGFTLIELIVAIAVGAVVMLAVGLVLVDSHRGYQQMYDKTFGDVVSSGSAARKTFDAVVRKANGEMIIMDSSGQWFEVHYYNSEASTEFDRYAKFYSEQGSLKVEYGTVNPRQVTRTEVVCDNVSSCVFTHSGRSAQMVLYLDDGKNENLLTCSAYMHNN